MALFANGRFDFSTREQSPRKRKNDERGETEEETRLRILLEMMDDEERAAFKDLMKQRVFQQLEVTHLRDDSELLVDAEYLPKHHRKRA
ncbi:MAG: hypothetical protein AAF125_07455 [Chloroflexota bacterium]